MASSKSNPPPVTTKGSTKNGGMTTTPTNSSSSNSIDQNSSSHHSSSSSSNNRYHTSASTYTPVMKTIPDSSYHDEPESGEGKSCWFPLKKQLEKRSKRRQRVQSPSTHQEPRPLVFHLRTSGPNGKKKTDVVTPYEYHGDDDDADTTSSHQAGATELVLGGTMLALNDTATTIDEYDHDHRDDDDNSIIDGIPMEQLHFTQPATATPTMNHALAGVNTNCVTNEFWVDEVVEGSGWNCLDENIAKVGTLGGIAPCTGAAACGESKREVSTSQRTFSNGLVKDPNQRYGYDDEDSISKPKKQGSGNVIFRDSFYDDLMVFQHEIFEEHARDGLQTLADSLDDNIAIPRCADDNTVDNDADGEKGVYPRAFDEHSMASSSKQTTSKASMTPPRPMARQRTRRVGTPAPLPGRSAVSDDSKFRIMMPDEEKKEDEMAKLNRSTTSTTTASKSSNEGNMETVDEEPLCSIEVEHDPIMSRQPPPVEPKPAKRGRSVTRFIAKRLARSKSKGRKNTVESRARTENSNGADGDGIKGNRGVNNGDSSVINPPTMAMQPATKSATQSSSQPTKQPSENADDVLDEAPSVSFPKPAITLPRLGPSVVTPAANNDIDPSPFIQNKASLSLIQKARSRSWAKRSLIDEDDTTEFAGASTLGANDVIIGNGIQQLPTVDSTNVFKLSIDASIEVQDRTRSGQYQNAPQKSIQPASTTKDFALAFAPSSRKDPSNIQAQEIEMTDFEANFDNVGVHINPPSSFVGGVGEEASTNSVPLSPESLLKKMTNISFREQDQPSLALSSSTQSSQNPSEAPVVKQGSKLGSPSRTPLALQSGHFKSSSRLRPFRSRIRSRRVNASNGNDSDEESNKVHTGVDEGHMTAARVTRNQSVLAALNRAHAMAENSLPEAQDVERSKSEFTFTSRGKALLDDSTSHPSGSFKSATSSAMKRAQSTSVLKREEGDAKSLGRERQATKRTTGMIRPPSHDTAKKREIPDGSYEFNTVPSRIQAPGTPGLGSVKESIIYSPSRRDEDDVSSWSDDDSDIKTEAFREYEDDDSLFKDLRTLEERKAAANEINSISKRKSSSKALARYHGKVGDGQLTTFSGDLSLQDKFACIDSWLE